MPEYQVLARKYRPQIFAEVVGQDAIVTTLKNAIKFGKLAHAYLFCGSRGTGKTTLARIFAKALNCLTPTVDGQPCTICSSCKEIAAGISLDVLEIDGASHRGIDDIRQINETVGYTPSSGKYKIYIIDEVHMLTKEAFNALLKTLEEPPPKVVFLFATTEPQKVLSTILSRCQRFNLNRIPIEKIIRKLQRIAQDLGIDVEEEALRLLAQRAEGGLRDAESLFDQMLAFHEGKLTAAMVSDVLGIIDRNTLFSLDQAGKQGNLSIAFDIAHHVFSQGKDILHFVDSLIEHFRNILLIKIAADSSSFLNLSESDRANYEISCKLYTQEQCLTLIDDLFEAQNRMRTQSSERIALEAILLHILRIHQRLPVEFLVRRLAELEQAVLGAAPSHPIEKEPPQKMPLNPSEIPMEKKASKSEVDHSFVTEDPTPTPQDLGMKPAKKSNLTSSEPTSLPAPVISQSKLSSKPVDPVPPQPPPPLTLASPPPKAKQGHYDTILQFAAVELEGSIQKKSTNSSIDNHKGGKK